MNENRGPNDIMFESLAENIQTEVAELFKNAPLDEDNPDYMGRLLEIVERNVPVIPELIAPVPLGLPLYRARYDSDKGFDDTDVAQFGYIHKVDRINRFRYNIAKEQVLYTATNPFVAYKEIETTNAPEYFYLSIFKKQGEGNFNVFPILPPTIAPHSNAERFLTAIEGIYPHYTSLRNWAQVVGNILESSPDEDLNRNYMFSSLAAHHILESCDALLTVSQKSNDRELNITFKKEAADLLELATVYHCKSLPHGGACTLMFDVDKIGIVVDGKVEWHRFEIDDIQPLDDTVFHRAVADKADQYLSLFPHNLKELKICVQKPLNEYHKVLAKIDHVEYCFNAKIKLV